MPVSGDHTGRVFKSEAPLDLSFIFQIQDLLRKNSELFYEKRVPQKSPDFRENEVYWIRSGKKISSCLIPTNRSVRFLRC